MTVPASWGACPPGVTVDFDTLSGTLKYTTQESGWVELDNATSADRLSIAELGSPLEVPVEGAPVVAGNPQSNIALLSPDVVASSLEAVGMGASLLLWVSPDEGWPIAVFDNGAVAWLGTCAAGFTDLLWQVLADSNSDQTPADFIRAALMLDSPEYQAIRDWEEERLSSPATQKWIDVDPRSRIIELPDAPQEVLDQLQVAELVLDLSPDWDAVSGVICPFAPDMGWSACVVADSAQKQGFLPTLLPHIVDGVGIELWLLNDDADIHVPIGRLGTIGWEVLRTSIDSGQALYVSLGEVPTAAQELESWLQGQGRELESRLLGVEETSALREQMNRSPAVETNEP
ncbi:MAG TPA: hypothetical protein VID03_05760 [Acidimicrobiia bacterium]